MRRHAQDGCTNTASRARGMPVLLLVLAACSSTTNNYPGVTCAEGTSWVDGVCVAASSDAADVAEDAGSADAPGSPPPDSEVGASSDDGVAADTHAPATPDAPADPCATLDVNCSKTCGGPSESCAYADCRWSGAEFDLRGAKDRVVLRTPDKPGWDSYCASACGPVKVASQLVLKARIDPGTTLRVRTPWPWSLYADRCGKPPSATCRTLKNTTSSVLETLWFVATTDPTAPWGDVIAEKVPEGTTCP